MTKIAFIGAGSTVFAKNLLGDILSYPELQDATISLHDIDGERLRTSEVVAHKVADALGVTPNIESSLDRRQALADSDYAITMIQVGGYKPSTVIDFDIPKKYGLRQTIADTLGIGGIMRGLRTIPVLLDMCHDMEELCPDVTLLQYVNPMVMNCMGHQRGDLHQDGGPLPQRPGHRTSVGRRHRRALRRDQLPLRRHQPYGLLPQVRAGRPRSLSRDPARAGRRPGAGLEPGALRDVPPPGLLRHRIQRAF